MQVAQIVREAFVDGVAYVRVTRARDIRGPDDLSDVEWSYGSGYRIDVRPVGTQVTLHVTAGDADNMQLPADQYYQSWMPAHLGVTQDQMVRLLEAYRVGSDRVDCLSIDRLSRLEYGMRRYVATDGKSYAVDELFFVIPEITGEDDEVSLATWIPGHIVRLDPSSGAAQYLGPYVNR